MSIFSTAFLKAAGERAVKSAAQALVLAWPVADGLLNIFDVNLERGLGVAAGGAVLSFLTSILSAGVGNSGPSLANEVATDSPESYPSQTH